MIGWQINSAVTMGNRRYLLDTNVLIELIHGNRTVINHIIDVGISSCAISVISVHELYYGAYNTPSEKYFIQEMNRIKMLLSRFKIISLPEMPDDYGRIKTSLRLHGHIVDEFDMMIAGQALFYGLTVVTNNLKHFRDIEDLKLEDWSK